jgi:hypothetical protein
MNEHISGLNLVLSNFGGSLTVIAFIRPKIPEASLNGCAKLAISI